ncbi:hypothetical protein D9757_001424 [Collybiopsis confluens]|uniref:RlpA-like protein double-psi beta-barrel domain-containing protein n=1 Tax=Collybiopsis confluens TaxID=2823264 RepID=A0A8H5HZ19_9AGAR|nr:hypothetical protein D9757_001424 [Collybiopsis confluens]
MFSFSLAAVTIALSTFSASARVVPRHHAIAARALSVPSTYDQDYLEHYSTYHARYLALGCQYITVTTFSTLAATLCSLSSREPRCKPDATVLSSISASLEGVTSTAAPVSSSAPTVTPSSDAAAASVAAPSPVAAVSSVAAPSPVAAVSNVAAPSPVADVASVAAPSPSSSSDDTLVSTEAWSSSSSSATWSSTSAPATTTAASSNVQTGGFATYFYQNGVAGACGTVHSDNDLIVAMDSAVYNQDICGKSVTITNTANGKSVTAVVADECPTCNNAQSIDLSLATFVTIGEVSTGLLDITWVWNN